MIVTPPSLRVGWVSLQPRHAARGARAADRAERRRPRWRRRRRSTTSAHSCGASARARTTSGPGRAGRRGAAPGGGIGCLFAPLRPISLRVEIETQLEVPWQLGPARPTRAHARGSRGSVESLRARGVSHQTTGRSCARRELCAHAGRHPALTRIAVHVVPGVGCAGSIWLRPSLDLNPGRGPASYRHNPDKTAIKQL